MDLEIGGQVRTLRFGIAEQLLLEKALGESPMTFLSVGDRALTFVTTAIMCGLVTSDKKMTGARVQGWLAAFTGSIEAVARNILLVIATARPGEDGKRQRQALEEAYARQFLTLEAALRIYEDAEPGPTKAG